MFEATSGLRPNVKQEIIVLEWSSLRGAGDRLKNRDDLGDGLLQVVRELREVSFIFHVVDNYVIGGSKKLKIFFGKVRNFKWSVGEPVVISSAEGVVGGVFHAGRDFPARRRSDGEFDGTFFAIHQIHPHGGPTDEGVAIVILRDVVLQRVSK